MKGNLSADGTDYEVITPGTYYIQCSSVQDCKFRYTFKSFTAKKKTKKTKAITLKKGKTEVEVFIVQIKNKLERWYKIKLTKKQRLQIKNIKGSVSLYDAKGNYVSASYDSTKGVYYTNQKLKKGTNYFRMNASFYNYVEKKNLKGKMNMFYWK